MNEGEGLEIYKDLADKLKEWFKGEVEKTFVSSAENFMKANTIEAPFAVILPQISQVESAPSLRDQTADFFIMQDFKIDFYFKLTPFRDKKGYETPFWAPLKRQERITEVLFCNLAAYFFDKGLDVVFNPFQCDINDRYLVLSYAFTRKYCFTSIKKENNGLISEFKISKIEADNDY